MFKKFYKFDILPFGDDPKCIFWGAQYCQAKGFVFDSLLDDNRVCCVLGDRGTGKTHLLNQLFSQEDEALLVARIWQPRKSPGNFLRSILVQFGFEPFVADPSEYLNILRAFLDHEQAQGKAPVIVIDQAETLTEEVRDEISRLVRIRQSKDDKLRLVFFGRPEFEKELDKTNLGHQALRRFHLYGLGEDEIADYIFHHFEFAGRASRAIFTPAAIEIISSHSGGIPHLVNKICLETLREGEKASKEKITKTIAQDVVKKLHLPHKLPHPEARYTVAPNSSPFSREAVDKLVITQQGKVVGSCLLTHRRTMIGRHPTSDILLDRSAVSAHHAQILMDDRGAHLLDMNSTNGTLVNFRKSRHHLLRNSDLIMIGDYRLKFVAGKDKGTPSQEAGYTGALTDTMVLEKNAEKKQASHLRRVK